MIRDNGIGIPDSVDIRITSLLGLIKLLSEWQLDGELLTEVREGTTFRIKIGSV